MRFPICWLIIGAAFMALGMPMVAAADDSQTCWKESGDVAIAACSRAIKSGRFKGHALAVIYTNRGIEYSRKNDYDRAIADCSDQHKW